MGYQGTWMCTGNGPERSPEARANKGIFLTARVLSSLPSRYMYRLLFPSVQVGIQRPASIDRQSLRAKERDSRWMTRLHALSVV